MCGCCLGKERVENACANDVNGVETDQTIQYVWPNINNSSVLHGNMISKITVQLNIKPFGQHINNRLLSDVTDGNCPFKFTVANSNRIDKIYTECLGGFLDGRFARHFDRMLFVIYVVVVVSLGRL